jgi:Phosphotransferase enzyme family
VVAGGVRIQWDDVPDHVRSALEAILGSPVRSAASQPGGFSPGTADRVQLADGRRAFIKAVGPELNPHSPGIHRREIHVMRALPPELPAPRLIGAYDDGDWVALALTDIDGRHPREPWDTDELDAVLSAMTDLSTGLTPSPLDDVGTVWSTLSHDLSAWPRVAEQVPADLDPWAVRNLDRLLTSAGDTEEVSAGPSLVHLDIRADNLLIAEQGVVFVDWPWACLGAPWLDLALFLCSVATIGGADPEHISRTHPVLVDVDPDAVTSVLAALAGYWTEACRAPEAPGLPTVREFQRRSGEATLRWLERRTGWR